MEVRMAAQLLLQHVKTPSGVCADILVDAGRIVRIAPGNLVVSGNWRIFAS